MANDGSPRAGQPHRRLDVFIGRWLTEGETVASPDAPVMKIFASDIYEWAPGGFFILHTAYGRIGSMDVGGTEMIGYDAASAASSALAVSPRSPPPAAQPP
jgi:hypothetical protein